MYTIQVEVQTDNQFTAKLFKNDKYIGGIENDNNEVYINLREKLSVQEMGELMTYVSNLNFEFKSLPVTICYIKDEDYIRFGLTKNDFEMILAKLAKYREENRV